MFTQSTEEHHMSGDITKATKPKKATKPSRIPRNPDKAFELGLKIGTQTTKDEVREEVLGYLEGKYMAADAPARGTAGAEAILEVTRDLAQYLRSL
jgi:hypothetical protein